MGITDYIISASMYQSQAKLQSDISTSLLKKTMDNGEAQALALIEQMGAIETVPNFDGTFAMHI